MKVDLVYPVPVDNLPTFQQDIDRFFKTLRQFDPGTDYRLVIVDTHWSKETPFAPIGEEAVELLSEWLTYTGHGCDLGSHQFVAHATDSDLMVCCSTRVYFHREGWLKRFVDAWNEKKTTLLGAMACFERAPHIRTCFYGIEPATFRKFPHLIQSRDHTFLVETGDWNITRWVKQNGGEARMATWDGLWDMDDWRKPANIYRRGDQSNCLVWDRHTELYAKADARRKFDLECYAGDHRRK